MESFPAGGRVQWDGVERSRAHYAQRYQHNNDDKPVD